MTNYGGKAGQAFILFFSTQKAEHLETYMRLEVCSRVLTRASQVLSSRHTFFSRGQAMARSAQEEAGEYIGKNIRLDNRSQYIVLRAFPQMLECYVALGFFESQVAGLRDPASRFVSGNAFFLLPAWLGRVVHKCTQAVTMGAD